MERSKVYQAIDTEIDHQIEIRRTIDEFALYVVQNSMKLMEVCAASDDTEEKLNLFRGIAGLCVACGEAHGMPERKVPTILKTRFTHS